MTFTEAQVAALTDDQLMEYMQDYVWYDISSDDRLMMLSEYQQRHPDYIEGS